MNYIKDSVCYEMKLRINVYFKIWAQLEQNYDTG